MLEFVKPSGDRFPHLNTILYGREGTSKTTGALSAPGPVLVLNAEGPNAVMFARERYGDDHIREVEVTGRDVLTQTILYLRDGGDGARSVVVDSLDALHKTLLEERAAGPDGRPGKPTLPQYGDVTTDIERFARALRDLPVNVVLVAHELAVKDEEAGHFERTPFTGTSNPALGVRLMEMYDVVGYCGVIQPPDGQVGEEQYVAQLVDANGRRGKDRTARLGKARELNLTEWLAAAQIATAVTASNGAAPIQTAKEKTPA